MTLKFFIANIQDCITLEYYSRRIFVNHRFFKNKQGEQIEIELLPVSLNSVFTTQ